MATIENIEVSKNPDGVLIEWEVGGSSRRLQLDRDQADSAFKQLADALDFDLEIDGEATQD